MEIVLSSGESFFIKQNDTLPILTVILVDTGCLGNKIPFDLSGATGCTFSMADCHGNMKIMAKAGQITSYSGGTIFKGVMDAINGGKKRAPQMTPTATFPGATGTIQSDDAVAEIQQQYLDWQINKMAHNLYQRNLG